MLRKALLLIIVCTLNATTMLKHDDEAWWTTRTILVHVVCSACWWLVELAIIEGYKLSTPATDLTAADKFFFKLKRCGLCLKIKLTRRKLTIGIKYSYKLNLTPPDMTVSLYSPLFLFRGEAR